jgi:hypothetical protein
MGKGRRATAAPTFQGTDMTTILSAIGIFTLILVVAIYAYVFGHNAAMRKVLKDIDGVHKQVLDLHRSVVKK